MRRHIKLLTTILILTLFMIFGLAGCSEKEVIPVTEPTVEITEDGELIAYLVEDFDKEYYDLGELGTMVREEVADFVREQDLVSEDGKEGMTVESVAMAADGSKKVVVALRFANSEIYADYFDAEAFFGRLAPCPTNGQNPKPTARHQDQFPKHKGDIRQNNGNHNDCYGIQDFNRNRHSQTHQSIHDHARKVLRCKCTA